MEIKKCVIAIAGMGTRFLPITKTVTKEMLPIVDVPAIFLQVKEAYKSGINEIIFVLSKKNYPLIKSFFTKDKYLEKFISDEPEKIKLLDELNEIIKNVKFHFIISNHPGSYGAVYCAKKYLNNEFFGVMFGDDIVDNEIPLLKQLINECQKTNNMVVAAKKYAYNELPNFGIIKYNQDNVIADLIYKKEVKEKEANVLQGRFILHTKIFSVYNKLSTFKHNETQLPTALLYFPNEVRALRYQGEYFDIGNKLGFIKANIYYALKNNEYKEDILNYTKNRI